jgi:hypothetical protein
MLKVQDLRVVMAPATSGGKTQFKLVLELPGTKPPSDILSEGEQRALSIAAFLAEVKLGKGRGGIVFDDPVSSLDHHRRWEVAERIAMEARERQVVVFTHDVYFMFWLQSAAEQIGAVYNAQYVRQTSKGYGDHSPDLPFETLSTQKRLGRLRNDLVKVRKAHSAGNADEATALIRSLYTNLRHTWERGVEDVLLNQAVQRFDRGVATSRLNQVEVDDADYKAVEAGMTRCSNFAHDPSKTIHLPTPHPDAVAEDIEALHTWQEGVLNRRSAIKKRRD